MTTGWYASYIYQNERSITRLKYDRRDPTPLYRSSRQAVESHSAGYSQAVHIECMVREMSAQYNDHQLFRRCSGR